MQITAILHTFDDNCCTAVLRKMFDMFYHLCYICTQPLYNIKLMEKEQLAGSKRLRLESIEMRSGVYFLYDEDELVYIGQAYNISRRIMDHLLEGTKKFNSVRYNLLPMGTLNDVEATLIKALRPKYNIACSNDCEYNNKETGRSVITFKPIVFESKIKRDGTMPVKIRFTYRRRSFYLPTNFFAYQEQVSAGKIVDEGIIQELQPILKNIRDAVKYISSDKSVEYVKSKVKALVI